MITRPGRGVQRFAFGRKLDVFVDQFGETLAPVRRDKQVLQKCQFLI